MKRALLLLLFAGILQLSAAQVFDIRDFGAAPGSGLNTTAIQAAVDSAEKAGGGIVLFSRWCLSQQYDLSQG